MTGPANARILRLRRAVLFLRFKVCLVFLEATPIEPLFQEGSILPRTDTAIPTTSSPSIVGSTPWRERAFLSMKIAAEVAGVSITTLYRFSDAGQLKLRDFGGRTLVDTQSLIALINSAKAWTPRDRGSEARAKRKQIARTALQS